MEKQAPKTPVILTGDRPSGLLHIGHYAGSIGKRLELQEQFEGNYIMIADMQALTDHAAEGKKVSASVLQLAIDYLACGLSADKNLFFIQSLVPQLAELTMLYMNFVTLARLKRNPTVKFEMKQKGYGDTVPIGFLAYPVSQAADITAFRATLVPAGEDQLPMIEQTNEIVRSINHVAQKEVLVECQALLSRVPRLPGLDGNAKMSKSLGNCIYLSDDEETVRKKVMSMYTDPDHLRVEDPGKVEGNPVFAYLEAFDPDQEGLKEMEDHYRRGGLGDVPVKKHLNQVLQELLGPIREKRQVLVKQEDDIMALLVDNSRKAAQLAASTLAQVRQGLGISY